MESVSAAFNALTTVKTSGCQLLQGIDLNHNNIEQLDFTGCNSLRLVDISFNKFSVEKALKMIETLPTATADEKGMIVYTNKADFPNEEETNKYAPELSVKANAKQWIMTDGEKDLPTVEVLAREERILVYPTVADRVVYIDGNYLEAFVFTLNGDFVCQLQGLSSIDTSNWVEGSYVIKAKVERGEYISKFLVKH